MIIAVLIACGSPASSPAQLDGDNGLEGSFVDEYEPTVTAVEIELYKDLNDAIITYLDGDTEFLKVRVTGGMPEQGNELERAPMAYVISDLVAMSDGAQLMSFQWTLDGETMGGSFESEFQAYTEVDPTLINYDVSGTFSGTVAWKY